MKKRNQLLRFSFFLLFGFWLLVAGYAAADTIITKDGRELKGIVVEDYKDRLTFSTADGEITVMKPDIGELQFDTEEDNLIKLAEQALDRKDYVTSYAYYDMAYKLNPDSKRAKDGMVFLHGYLFRKEQVEKEEMVKRQDEFEHRGEAIAEKKTEEEEFKEASEKLKNRIGIVLKMKEGLPKIDNIIMNSPAYEAGIRKGDLLVAIWGKLTGYMPLKEIMDTLLEKPALEIKCTIERTVDIAPSGTSFSMEFDGLTISNVEEGSPSSGAGLRKDDLIVAIDGKSTRYMPLKKALELISGSKEKKVSLTLRRELILWRKEGA